MYWHGECWTVNSQGYFAIGKRYLHRERWAFLRGPIPKGWVVHHKDHNKQNNKMSNLACVSHVDHCRMHLGEHIHSEAGRRKGAEVLALSAKARGQAIAAGKAKTKKTRLRCVHCQKSFWATNQFAKSCSRPCYMRDYYQKRKATK